MNQRYNILLYPFSALDPDPLDPQDSGFLEQAPRKYADPQIWIQVPKYQPKHFTLNTKI